MEFKTKEYPKGEEVVITEVAITYSQTNEAVIDEDNHLKLSIHSQGAGFYYVMETERWAFNTAAELAQILADFKQKAGID